MISADPSDLSIDELAILQSLAQEPMQFLVDETFFADENQPSDIFLLPYECGFVTIRSLETKRKRKNFGFTEGERIQFELTQKGKEFLESLKPTEFHTIQIYLKVSAEYLVFGLLFLIIILYYLHI